jgi:ParB family chromosome partitioning protein
VTKIIPIPLERIRPFKGQPRKYFDPIALQELADSISEIGQRTPAWVMADGDGYQLIAGERRWRACALAGIETLLCEVRKAESANSQYVDSVLENFGRKDCTVMETAFAIKRVTEIYFGSGAKHGDAVYVKVARIFARSVAWVQQHRSLLNLDVKVQAMLNPALPADKRLPTQVAVSLANLRHEDQVRLAGEIIERGMKFRSALAFVRGSKTEEMRVRKNGRTRSPAEDFRMFRRFLENLGQGAQIILGMPVENTRAMFVNRPAKDLTSVIAVLRKRAKQLETLAEKLES